MGKDIVFWVIALVAIALPQMIFWGFLKARHKRVRLACYERGFRFGKSVIASDEIQTVTLGDSKSQGDALPTYQSILELKSDAMKQSRDLVRAASMIMTDIHGRTIVWKGLLLYFSPSDCREFLSLLNEHYPLMIDDDARL